MIKLIWISDVEKESIVFWSLKKIAECNTLINITGTEAEEILAKESIDFLFIDIKKPANTDDMQRLCLRYNNCLRVSIFKLHPSRSRIIRFLFPPGIIKTIVQNSLIRRGKVVQENPKL